MPPETEESLGSALLGTIARLNRWVNSRADLDRLSVPFAQVRLLSLVGQLAPVRISDLAAADHTSQPTVTQQLGRLDAAGWITRTPDATDARVTRISLSVGGENALRDARTARAEVIAPYLAEMGIDERAAVAAAADALADLERRLSRPSAAP